MVRKYKRKTNRQQWEKSEMIEAVTAVVEKRMSVKTATEKFNIPKTTLVRWCQKAKSDGIESCDIKLGRFKTVFSEEQEYKLKQYIKDMHLSLCELSSLELRRIAFQYAEINNIKHSFNKETRLAGQDWYSNFMKRHKDIKQNSSNSPLFGGLNNTCSTEKFFDLLTDLQQFYKFPSNRIYNVNETGFISIPNFTSKIVSAVDKNALNTDFITIITCCNAAGNFIPPLMIFPTDTEDSEYIDGCPSGTKIVCHPSGSIQNEIFFPTWFYHFVNYAKPSNIDPILLLLNGRAIHVKNIEFIEKAKESNIHILSLPLNTTLKLHPLELTFMETLKKHYAEEQNKYIQAYEGQYINLKNVGKIFGIAYMKAAIPSNAIDGFQASGIYPLNRYIFSNAENAPEITPSIIQILQDNIHNSVSEVNNDVASTSNSQNKNCGLVIKGPSDINHTITNEELSFSLFDDLINDDNSDTIGSYGDTEESKIQLDTIFVERLPDINKTGIDT